MSRSVIVTMAFVFGFASIASAATSGTKEQQDACRPDVRKFCYKLKESDGDDAFLRCLELNRSALSQPCSDMLKNYGK